MLGAGGAIGAVGEAGAVWGSLVVDWAHPAIALLKMKHPANREMSDRFIRVILIAPET
jgi:hypothetical protein